MTTSAAQPAAAPVPSTLPDEERIERAREAVHTHLRRVLPAATSSAAFTAAAAALAFFGPHSTSTAWRIGVAVAAYALASRVQFEVGIGLALPTQLFFVPMWFIVPAGLLPAAIAAAALVAVAPEFVRHQLALDRLLLQIVGAWYAFGPALVLVAAGDAGAPRWSRWPVYIAALVAQIAVNYVSMMPHVRQFGFGPVAQLRMMVPALAVDAALAPVGLVVAFAVQPYPGTLALILPMVGVLAYFARERRRRVDHALELSQAYRGTAFLLGDVIEADDAYTGTHSRDVVALSRNVGERLGLAQRELRMIELTALLHDVGKIKIPSEIINKPEPLTPEERAMIETHTIEGERLLSRIGGLLGEVGAIVRSCHERWDGLGYPDRLAGDEIPLIARIVCCCDAFNAMTTDRPYRAARSVAEALAEVERCGGSHFDPAVAVALATVVRGGMSTAA